MNDQTLLEKIEAYLDGQLDPATAANFEAEMAGDAKLKAEVDAYRKANKVIEYAWKKDLKAQLQDIDKELNASQKQENIAKTKIRRVPMWRKLAVAASLLFAIGTIGYLMQPKEGSTNKSFAELYMDNANNTSRGKGNSNSMSKQGTDLQDGVEAFKAKKFDLAIELFNQVLNGPESYYQQDAEWYLAGVFKEKGEIATFRRIAEEISKKNGHNYQKDAIFELSQLKQ